MKQFFRFFAERHTFALVVTFLFVFLGLGTFRTIQRDMFPRTDFGEVIIVTRYPGASPEDVELSVTNPIEDEIKEIAGIDRFTSYSMENLSFIDVVVDFDEKDQDEVVREIREAVNSVTELPAEVDEAPVVTEINSSIFPVIEIGFSGENGYRQLREFARQFEKKLENLDGVASVDKYGYRDREVWIEVDADKIRENYVPLRTLIGAIQARNIRSTAGSFESYTSEKNVVTLAQFEDPLEVGDVIVRTSFEGPAIKVKDLARIVDGYEEEKVRSRMNGRPAISFLVNKKETADVIRTVDEIRALVEEERNNLPEGVVVQFSDDLSRYVRNRLDVVRSNGLIGLGFVLCLLAMFLSLRMAFWVALGIPVAIMGTVFLLPLFGQIIDVVSMAGMIMVVGIVVDDAIIIAENIHRKRELGLQPVDAAVEGLSEVYKPVVTTILTTFVAFAPMFFMSGIMGKVVYVIPLTISLALFISLIEGTVALPAHVIWGAAPHRQGTRPDTARGWFDYVRRFYRKSIRVVLMFRYAVVVFAVASLGAGLWYAATHMDFILFPTGAADKFYVRLELPRGSSLDATSDKVAEIEALVEALPEGEVDSYVTRIGEQGLYVAGENENWAIVSVYLTPFATRDRIADEIVADLRAQTDRLAGFERIIYYVDAGGPPVGEPVTIRVVGNDDETRVMLADSVVAALQAMDGVKDVDRNDKLGKDQVELILDYEKLSRLGLTVADVARNVRIAFDGEIVTSVRYGDEDVEFRVILNEKIRRNPVLLGDLLVPNAHNRLIPLKSVMSARVGPASSSIYHFDNERAIRITADVDQGIVTPLQATNAVQERFDLRADYPGMRFEIGGEAQETEKSMNSLMTAFASAAVAIYLILVVLFNSPVQPLLVMSAIPLGVLGVIVAFALHGQPLGFTGVMGLIGLSGVVVNDSLVLVNHINRLKKERPGERLLNIVSDGAADRLRAVILTSLTTVAGLLPLAYGIGGSDPFIAPMALAMGFGLLFATPITLALIPSLYLISDDFKRVFLWIGRLFARKRVSAPRTVQREVEAS
jgi:multidrug efflux pump subunit AcrB